MTEPIDTVVATFTLDKTDVNVWVFLYKRYRANGDEVLAPVVEVATAPKGTRDWLPHMGDVTVELQESQ